ncbi:MerR family transcriptional regulator [Actinomyces sp. 2119]|uniref:MerR family transcriptional regulator n=1 Tax=Actinomyces lilanjuaniae TaxID=2321394 RepID=A0ABN5PR67_9ACTO|nr:MerR family transcriptional regulator [Actinomyces lilanjuaniae]RJF44957.1 MerR family transcriptional regulator [Actinomyces sp. 2119]
MKIGQVVDALRPEFPALSISKLRYLEGAGLISPYRVGNGYRRYSQADIERLRYSLRAQRDEYLPLSVIRQRLAELDAGAATAPVSPVARVVARDGRLVDSGPMDLESLLALSGARESQVDELVAVGLISPDARGLYSSGSLRTVRLALEITRLGIPLRNLRSVRSAAEREADAIDQAVTPRRSRSRDAGEESARTLADLVGELHDVLLHRAVDTLS